MVMVRATTSICRMNSLTAGDQVFLPGSGNHQQVATLRGPYPGDRAYPRSGGVHHLEPHHLLVVVLGRPQGSQRVLPYRQPAAHQFPGRVHVVDAAQLEEGDPAVGLGLVDSKREPGIAPRQLHLRARIECAALWIEQPQPQPAGYAVRGYDVAQGDPVKGHECPVQPIRMIICGSFFAVGCVALPRVVPATARHRALPTTKNPPHIIIRIDRTGH